LENFKPVLAILKKTAGIRPAILLLVQTKEMTPMQYRNHLLNVV